MRDTEPELHDIDSLAIPRALSKTPNINMYVDTASSSPFRVTTSDILATIFLPCIYTGEDTKRGTKDMASTWIEKKKASSLSSR